MLAGCQVGICGVGLLGGSVAARLSSRGMTVRGWDPDPEVLDFARERGFLAEGTDSPEALAQASDLLVLAAPLGRLGEAGRLLAAGSGKALKGVFDVGSSKVAVGRELAALWGDRYAGLHPLAGREGGTVRRASADLFEGCLCTLVPFPDTAREVRDLGRELGEALGARVQEMGPAEHDALAAWGSHLPLLAASALALAAEEGRREHPDLPPLAAGGYRDGTRMAESPPWLLADLWETNGVELRRALDRYIVVLEAFRDLAPQDVWAWAERAREARRRTMGEIPGRWRA